MTTFLCPRCGAEFSTATVVIGEAGAQDTDEGSQEPEEPDPDLQCS